MSKKAFTLIELLAVIVILAIIALIAVPIIINIINDSKRESQKRSIEGYARTLKQSSADYQIKNNKQLIGRFGTTDGKVLTKDNITFNVDYKGNVVCDNIILNRNGTVYLSECTVDGTKVDYEYGETTYGMIAEKTSTNRTYFLETSIPSYYISKFTIHNDIEIQEGYNSEDCSYNHDQSVMCYWKEISNNLGHYEMHLAADGELYTPPNSYSLFMNLGGENSFNSLQSLNLVGLNTKYTTNMSYMFASAGTNISELNFGENFDTSKVTNMESMFKQAFQYSIIDFKLPKTFNTKNVTNMSKMFYRLGYYQIPSIDLGINFDTSSVTNMESMFVEMCASSNMSSLDLGDKFDTSKVTNMQDMFKNTGKWAMKTLDLGTKFEISNNAITNGMFVSCGKDGVLTKVIVPNNNTKTRIEQLISSNSVPQFWIDNNIIEVQSN